MLQDLVGIPVPTPVWPILNVKALQESLLSTYTEMKLAILNFDLGRNKNIFTIMLTVFSSVGSTNNRRHSARRSCYWKSVRQTLSRKIEGNPTSSYDTIELFWNRCC